MTRERPTWDYLVLEGDAEADLSTLGREGWELVGVGSSARGDKLYFKRPGPNFRERMTLDQRRQAQAAGGHAVSADSQPPAADAQGNAT